MKTIVITGISGGIGFHTAKYFLQKGHKVFGISRSALNNDELESLGEFHFIKADITKTDELETVAKLVSSNTHIIDILINNAGILINKPFAELSNKDFTLIYSTNVFAAAGMIKSLIPLMIDKKDRTHIINIGSMGGFQGSSKFPGLSAYSSSKAALANLTECLAEELKENNISINCLALGSVNTTMLQKAFPDYTANTDPSEMADFIGDFALSVTKLMNGKIIPVSITTP